MDMTSHYLNTDWLSPKHSNQPWAEYQQAQSKLLINSPMRQLDLLKLSTIHLKAHPYLAVHGHTDINFLSGCYEWTLIDIPCIRISNSQVLSM